MQTIQAPDEIGHFGDEIVVDGDRALITAPDPGSGDPRVYVFERVGAAWVEQASLAPSRGDWDFASSVALCGDVVVVGALAARAVYVFERLRGSWVETARLTSGGELDTSFGAAVATDSTTIFVGAPEADPPARLSGEVLLFERDPGGEWLPAGELAADKERSYDDFGQALAVEGDRLAVGARGFGGVSAVFVLERAGPGQPWEQVAELTPLDPDWGLFNTHLVLEGDALLAGSYFDGGLLYLRDPAGAWGFSERLEAPDGGTLGGGFSMTSERLAIGDRRDDDAGQNAGAVYIYDGPVGCDGCDFIAVEVSIDSCPGPLSFTVREATPFGAVELYMGVERAPTPNVGGPCDGIELGLEQAVLLDTFIADATGSVVGDVEVLAVACGKLVQALDIEACTPSEVVWTQTTKETTKLMASDGAEDDEFGYTVAVSGDRLAVAAREARVGGVDNVGAAYVFDRQADGSWLETAKLEPLDGRQSQMYGIVALEGDYLALGGSQPVHLFERDPVSGDWAEVAQLSPPGFKLGYNTSLAFDGELLVVGDPLADVDGVERAGSVAVFERQETTGEWVRLATLRPPVPRDNGNFGECVEIDGRTIVAGVDENELYERALLVYLRGPLGNWFLSQELVSVYQEIGNPTPSCAFEGDTAARRIGSGADERIVIFDRVPGTPGPWSESPSLFEGSRAIDMADGFLATVGSGIYFRPGGSDAPWIEFSRLDASDGQNLWQSGRHGLVAIDGPVVAHGADWDDELAENAGAVYLWDARGAGGSWREEDDE